MVIGPKESLGGLAYGDKGLARKAKFASDFRLLGTAFVELAEFSKRPHLRLRSISIPMTPISCPIWAMHWHIAVDLRKPLRC